MINRLLEDDGQVKLLVQVRENSWDQLGVRMQEQALWWVLSAVGAMQLGAAAPTAAT